jgi:4-amino-4-deoxy-L-arabinose transferase-like glycosyltransferase
VTTESQTVEYMVPSLVLAGPAPSWVDESPRPKSIAASLLTKHWLLLFILVVQAGLTLRLSNTAFNDEANYLNVGHLEIAHLLHGTVIPNFADSLSGAPFLYPILAAVIDSVGGLELVRGLSLASMLATTMLVFGFSRRIFGWAFGVLGAATFAMAASVIFLGHLATYDAPTVFMLALATWLIVVGAQMPGTRGWVLALGAGLAAGLASMTKYAGLLYLPTILATGVLVAMRPGRRLRAIVRISVPFLLGAGGLLILITSSAPELLVGLRVTTTERQLASAPWSAIVGNSALYVGGMLLLALAGAVMLVRRHVRVEQQLLGLVLAATGFLAPLAQLHFHTTVSLQKNAGYGLVFAAPMVGVALAESMKHWRRKMLLPLVAILLTLISLGANTSETLFVQWPNTTNLVQLLQGEVQRGQSRYLVEEAAVPEYYLATRTNRSQWVSTYTYSFHFPGPHGGRLFGPAAFEAGIAHGYFEVIALRNGSTRLLDFALEHAIGANPRYQLIARLPFSTSFGPGVWRVWVRRR